MLDGTCMLLAALCIGLFLWNKQQEKPGLLQIALLLYALAVLVASLFNQWQPETIFR
ncbi:hypothetical protein [Pseudobacillus badius]|uniref:hypothetical protein n=1 Tax=Bacillus badius TaxID=1455 RepID=UPI002552BD28|nr:hypothetical protein [Bacillus badius]